MEKFGWALRECAVRVQDSETILRVDWELLNRGKTSFNFICFAIFFLLCLSEAGISFPNTCLLPAFQPKSDWRYDIHRSLEDITPVTPKPSVVLRAEDIISSGECAWSRCFTIMTYDGMVFLSHQSRRLLLSRDPREMLASHYMVSSS